MFGERKTRLSIRFRPKNAERLYCNDLARIGTYGWTRLPLAVALRIASRYQNTIVKSSSLHRRPTPPDVTEFLLAVGAE